MFLTSLNYSFASLQLSCFCTSTEGPVDHSLPTLPTLLSSVIKIVPDTWQLLNKNLWTGRITNERGTFPTLEQVSLRLTTRQGQAESLLKWKVHDGLKDFSHQVRGRICKCLYFTFVCKQNLNCLKTYKT